MTAKLKSDHLGFLVGTPTEIGDALKIWRDIKDDVAAIRSSIGTGEGGELQKVAQGTARQAANDATHRVARPRLRSSGAAERTDMQNQCFTKSDSRNVRTYSSSARGRDASGRFVSLDSKSAPDIVSAIKESAESANQLAEKANRDANGRFMKSRGAQASNDNSEHEAQEQGLLRRIGAHVGTVMSGANIEQVQEVDPTIMAANELNSILSPMTKAVSPIGRGFGRVMRSGYRQLQNGSNRAPEPAATNNADTSDQAIRVEKRKASLLERIWGTLVDIKVGEEKQGKQTLKSLTALGDRTHSIDGKSDGFAGGLGGTLLTLLAPLFAPLLNLLRMIPIVGRLIPAFGRLGGGAGASLWGKAKSALGFGTVAGAAVVTEALGGSRASSNSTGDVAATAKPKSRLGRLAGGASKLLKKIPLLGGVLALGGMAMDANAVESDDTLSDDEKTDKHVTNVSKTAGSLGGMAAGAVTGATIGSVIPIVGTAIGGVVGGFMGSGLGEIVGGLVGGWVNDLRRSDLVKWLGKKWDGLTESMSLMWGRTVKSMSSMWDGAIGSLSDFWMGTKNKVGELWDETGKVASGAIDSTSEAVVNAKKWATNKFESVVDGFVNSKAVQTVTEAATGKVEQVKRVVETVRVKAAETAEKGKAFVAPVVESAEAAGTKAVDAMANTRAGKVAIAAGGVISSAMSGVKKVVVNRWGNVRDLFGSAADKAGVDAGLLAQIGYGESGFDTDAAPIARDKSKNKRQLFDGRESISSAHGLGQFLDDTWTEMINKYGAKYGVEGGGDQSRNFVGKMSKESAAKYRSNPEIQAAMLAEFTKENVEKGRKYGGADDSANVYAFHNLGDSDAKKMFSALKASPEMSIRDALLGDSSDKKRIKFVDQVMSGNKSLYGDGSISVSEAYKNQGDFMRRGDMFANDIRATRTQAAIIPAITSPVVMTTNFSSLNNAPIVAPKIPVFKGAPDMPSPSLQLNPLGSSKPMEVSVKLDRGDVGQDVKDRGIAHIATGGISPP